MSTLPKLEDILVRENLTIEQLAEIINRSGGRPILTDIVKGVTCATDGCMTTFFTSTPSPKAFCFSCKEDIKRRQSAERAKRARKNKKDLLVKQYGTHKPKQIEAILLEQ